MKQEKLLEQKEQLSKFLFEYIDVYTILLKKVLEYQDIKLERTEVESRNLFDEISILLMRANCLKDAMYKIQLEGPK